MMDNVDDHLIDQTKKFKRVAKVIETLMYPVCVNYSILSDILALFNLIAKRNWIDSSFKLLLEILGKIFSTGSELPRSTYYAKKLTYPLCLEYVKIPTCSNDYILYLKYYENLNAYLVCDVLRYKQKHNKVVNITKESRKG